MVLNFLIKAAFVQGEFENFDKKYYTKNDIVRMDFNLENAFPYLLGYHYSFVAISTMNKKEKHVWDCTKKLLKPFLESYTNPIKNL